MALTKVALVLALVAVANATVCPLIYNYQKVPDLNAIVGTWHAHFLPNNGNSSGFTGDCVTSYVLNTRSDQVSVNFCGPRASNPQRVECSPILGTGTVTLTKTLGKLIYSVGGVDFDARITVLDQKRGILMGTACKVIEGKAVFAAYGFSRNSTLTLDFLSTWVSTTIRNGVPIQRSVRINQRENCARAISC